MQREREDQPVITFFIKREHLSLGLWRSSFDADRSIISEKRTERLDRSCISNHPQFRLAHECAAINLMFRQKL
ncbi:hypothetical protein ACYCVF_35645 [Bradyrhizobium sp. 1.29L]